MYKHLENKMCKELEILEEKYRTGTEMSEGDLRRIDLLVHSLKSLATYNAMKDSEEYNSSYSMGSSYNYRGRDERYMNRDPYRMDTSGHYPPMYPEERRW